MFAATQILQRPGVAQTQAVFAREFSAGGGDGAQLFRQSLTQSREINRLRSQIADMTASASGAAPADALDAARTRLAQLEQSQTQIQSRLSDYPRYRVLAPTGIALADLQHRLKPGEVYFQLRVIGSDAYTMLIGPQRTQAARLAAPPAEIDHMVEQLRASIVTMENGVAVTYPFDIVLAEKLYGTLFDGLDDPLGGVSHIVFDPDGAMLTLPINLLVTDHASVERYQARLAKPNADEFDFTGTAWLGRDRDVTTAVSPQAFLDIRAIPPSRAPRSYLGIGENALPSLAMAPAAVSASGLSCNWPLATWQHPISTAELTAVSHLIGNVGSTLITGADFTDTALRQRTDLDQFRILHFATHGLVTAPRPECPARPALLTSFGPVGQSDGLLSFDEIFDLKLDADIVLLSACDTAGSASAAATREAGLSGGGDYALDGLVRAFVGAGTRTVIASHWPVPDDFRATERLVLGLFDDAPGTTIGTAMRLAQRKLMDDPATSHPYYWSAFAIVGDGSQVVLPGEAKTR
jgi:CHAT domain-containing protein